MNKTLHSIITIVVFISLFTPSFGQSQHIVDSLLNNLKSAGQDSSKVNLLNVNIAKTYSQQGNYAKAIEYGLIALKIAQEINAYAEISLASEILADNYAKQKDFKKAYQFQRLFKETYDSLNVIEAKNALNITEMRFALENEKHEAEKQNIRLKNQEVEIKQYHTKTKIAIGLFAGILLIISIIVIYYLKIQKSNRKNIKTEEKYRIVADFTYDMEYWTDVDGKIIYISPSCERITGYKPEDFYKDKHLLITIIHPEDREPFLKHKHEKDSEGNRLPVDFRIIAHNNETHWIGHVCAEVFGNSGEYMGIRGSNRLINKQKEIEKTIQESEGDLRLLNTLTTEMLNMNDLKSIYEFISASMHKRYPNTIILYNSIDESKMETCLEAVFGLSGIIYDKVISISKINPIKKKFRLFPEYVEFYKSNKLIDFKGGLVKFSAGEWPVMASKALDKLLGIHKIYTIGITKEDTLFGSIHFFTFKHKEITDNDFVETFVKQAGIILQIKQAEIALKESREQLQSIFDISPSIMLLLNNKGEIIDVNKTGQQFAGMNLNQLKGKQAGDTFQCIHSLLNPKGCGYGDNCSTCKLRNSYEDTIKTSQSHFKIESELIRWDADKEEKHTVLVSTIPVSETPEPTVLVVLDDITKIKKTEESLRNSEQLLKDAQKTAHIGHWELDLKTNNFIWSDEVFRIFDLKPQEFKATLEGFLNQVHPDDKSYVSEAYETSLKNNTEYNIIHRLIPKNGKTKYVNERSKNTYDDDGNPVNSVGTVADITDLVEKEQHIQQQNKELKELNITKDKFFSIIAHDLRSPFNALLGFTDLLMDEIRNKDFVRIEKYAEILSRSAQQNFNLLNNLLEWAGMQMNGIQLKPQIILLEKTVETVTNLLKNNLDEKHIKFTTQISPNLAAVADVNMLETVLRNLLTNAIKFTPNGGSISLSINQSDTETEICISDSGVGISAENIQKLFKIETNSSTPGTNKEKGTGLGLILCKEFVEKNGGKIWVESEEGKGSEFKFTLPLS